MAKRLPSGVEGRAGRRVGACPTCYTCNNTAAGRWIPRRTVRGVGLVPPMLPVDRR